MKPIIRLCPEEASKWPTLRPHLLLASSFSLSLCLDLNLRQLDTPDFLATHPWLLTSESCSEFNPVPCLVLFCPWLPPLSWRQQFFTPLPSGVPPSFPTYQGHPRLSHLAVNTKIRSQTNVVLLATSRHKWVWHHFRNLTLFLFDRKSTRQWCQGTYRGFQCFGGFVGVSSNQNSLSLCLGPHWHKWAQRHS